MGREVSLALVLIGALASCELAAPMRSSIPPLDWKTEVTLELDAQGQSEAASLSFPVGQRFIALRATPEKDTGGVCFRFEPVVLLPALRLSPSADEYDTGLPCPSCTESFLPARDVALAILPTGAAPLPAGGQLSLRVVARDCALGTRVSRARVPGLPSSLQLASAWEPAVEASARGRLHVRVAVVDGAALEPALEEALWRGVQAVFEPAGISLVLERSVLLAARPDLMVHAASDGDLRAFGAELDAALGSSIADARHVRLAFLPCLRVELDVGPVVPYAYTVGLPGLVGAGPAFVLVSAGRCDGPSAIAPWPAELGAALVAHELGHQLGLFHTETSAGRAQAGGVGLGRLMDAQVADVPASEQRFSPGQVAVLRRHPDVVFAP